MLVIAAGTVFVLSLAALSWAIAPGGVGDPVAPDPEDHPGAVVQVYGADVWGFRGRFAIHTWIATKDRGASEYRNYQVIGWRLRRNGTAVSISEGDPARPWFGSLHCKQCLKLRYSSLTPEATAR